MIYACLYAQEFPAQALLRLRPELRDKPCVVMDGNPPLQQVCSLNRRARTLGMATGMTKVEAETFPAITLLARSLQEETATSAVLLQCAGTFSPHVEHCSEGSAFLCALDIAGTEKLFGPPEMLAQKLLHQIKLLGIAARIAISSNFHAAIALAKGMPPQTAARVIRAGEEAAALAPLPLSNLNLTEEQAETFSQWGINTLGMLAALPEKELIARMGQPGKCLRQLACGTQRHLFQPIEPAFTLAEHMELDSPVEVLDSLLFVLGTMLEQLVVRASARALALASINVTLTLEGGATHSRMVRPALPSNDKVIWLKLLHLDLEAHPPQAAILALVLAAEPGPTSKEQLGLFSPQLPEPARLDVTLARIRAIVGEDCAGRIVLADTHEPDAFRVEPFQSPAAPPSPAPPAMPRSVMRQLRPAEAVCLTLQSERPQSFVFREQRYVVEHAYGPWLTSGNWWAQTLWGWEQWDIIARAHDGGLLCCCMARGLMRNQWQIAALYD